MAGSGGWLLILILLLTVWNPANLALHAASAVWNLNTRSTLSLVFLAARLAITSVGVAAGIALWLRRPGAVWLAKLVLVLFGIEAALRLSARVDLSSAPPGTRLPLAVVVIAHNAGWYSVSPNIPSRQGHLWPRIAALKDPTMHRRISLLLTLALCLMPSAAAIAQGQAAGRPLDIYFIDTEGGQATLYVSPSGQTLLVDTGNSGERDLNRILDVLTAAGVKQIDHMWLTHYHGDHYGSMVDLSKRIAIKQLYDHGPSIEGDRPNVAAFQKVYAELYAKIPRSVVKPGDKIAFTGADMTAVMSDGNPLTTPIAKAPGAGRPNPLCAASRNATRARSIPTTTSRPAS